jgi:hypothetical protein
MVENYPDDRVELLRLWVAKIDELMELAERPPPEEMMAAQGGPAGPAGPAGPGPGGPPAPEQPQMDPAMMEQMAMMAQQQ